ncbi:hypothetical protein NC651_010366 [Populus alba x Populus x berolinensis]|nr:hypothetical protein NC651_010366 [Populus alba x Populus x berolinensis]
MELRGEKGKDDGAAFVGLHRSCVSWDLLDDKANKKESRDDLLISPSKLLMVARTCSHIKLVSALVRIAS